MPRPLLLVLPLLLLAACTPPTELQQRYYDAQATALKQSTPAYAALGLRFGLDSVRVRQHLDSLRQRDELVWQLSTHQLPIQFAEPQYVGNRLARLDLKLQGSGLATGPEYGELLRGLSTAYGSEGYEHSPGGMGGVRSWFTGGQEVRLMNLVGYGYALDYIDLSQANALTDQKLREGREEMRQMKREYRQRK